MKRILALFLILACLALPAGAARNFDGTDDKMTATATITAIPLTICAWVNADTLANTVIFTIGDQTANGFFSIEIRTAGTLRVKNQDDTFLAHAANTTTGSITTGTWNSLCGVFTANNNRSAFINGANKVTETTAVGTTTVDTFVVGALIETGAYGAYFDGSIAEIAIWNSTLTDDEVAAVAKAYDPCFVKRTGCTVIRIDGNGASETSNRGDSFTLTGTTKADHPRMFYSF